LWKDLTAAAIYHTNRTEGNALSFEEASAIIDQYRKNKVTAVDERKRVDPSR
jgi:hypothetical protein